MLQPEIYSLLSMFRKITFGGQISEIVKFIISWMMGVFTNEILASLPEA